MVICHNSRSGQRLTFDKAYLQGPQFKSKGELTTSCTEDLGSHVCKVYIRTKETMQEMEKVHTWKRNCRFFIWYNVGLEPLTRVYQSRT